MGFNGDGYADYRINDNNTLVCVSRTNTFGGQYDVSYPNDVFTRITD